MCDMLRYVAECSVFVFCVCVCFCLVTFFLHVVYTGAPETCANPARFVGVVHTRASTLTHTHKHTQVSLSTCAHSHLTFETSGNSARSMAQKRHRRMCMCTCGIPTSDGTRVAAWCVVGCEETGVTINSACWKRSAHHLLVCGAENNTALGLEGWALRGAEGRRGG